MGIIADTANAAFRDYVIDDVPSSGPNSPVKSEIRDIFATIEATVGVNSITFPSLAAASAANIPAAANIAVTLGRNAPGDNGGASYVRIGSSTAALWRFQSADGQWWALNNRTVTPEMFGCFGGSDCTAGFVAMATWLNTFTGGGGITINSTPNSDYKIWPIGTRPTTLMRLTSIKGVTFNFNGARISSDNAFGFNDGPILFYMEHCSNITFFDPSYKPTAWSGSLHPADFGSLFFIGESAAPWSYNIHVFNAVQDGGSAFFTVSCIDPNIAGGGHAKNFSVINADISNVFYGLNFQASGDNFFARGIRGTNIGRLYFPWNVSNHDVEAIGNGSAAGFVLCHLKVYALPKATEIRRSLSNIRLRYRDSSAATTSGTVCGLFMEQQVPQVNVTGAADNGTGLLRLTVNTTADMATNQTWFVNGVGGITGVNGKTWQISVFSSTQVDLLASNTIWGGSYTSGGYLRVPATIKNITIDLDVTALPTVTQAPAFVSQKNNSDGTVDTTTDGYTIENVRLGGTIKNYNFGIRAISLFKNDGNSTGTWAGESIRNIFLRDLTVTGTSTSVEIDATNISSNLVIENIWSTPTTVPWTITGAGANTRIMNTSATGLTDNILSGTNFIGTLVGSSIAAPASPATGKVNVWFDSTDARLHDINSFGTVATTVVPDTGTASQWIRGITNSGVPFKSQPAFSDISGTITAGQLPGLTTAMFAVNVVDTDVTLSAASSSRIPAQSAVKSYVDNIATGLSWKSAVIVGTTANITLSGEQTIDGVLTNASRVLVKNQSTASQNGIYVSGGGAWSRSADMDAPSEFPSATVFVESGTVNSDTQWTCTNNSVIVGTTSVAFAQVAGAGTYSAGTGLQLSANQFSIDGAIVGRLATANTWALAQTFSTSVTSPLYTGGTAASSTLVLESTSGTGTSDSIQFKTGSQVLAGTIATGGQHVIGPNGPVASAIPLLDINASAAATAVPTAGAITPTARLIAPNGAATLFMMQNYGVQNIFQMFAAGGTAASPTALASGGTLFNFQGYPYDGTNYGNYGLSQSSVTMQFQAAENLDATHHGTKIVFATTPNGTISKVDAVTIQASGGFSVGTSNDALTGGVLANGPIKSQSATAGIGYATGAGGSVTQATSRTTGVTLNTAAGAITLVSAAGSPTPASFTVTNSAVAATDVVIVNQKSGTDLYEIFVTNVAAGSFKITFFTTGGTTTEQPVFNFALIKGVTS